MYVYLESEPHLYTVGFYSPDGKWNPESDWDSMEAAAERSTPMRTERPWRSSMGSVLFVCSGNRCRSPMSEALLKRRLGIAGITGVNVFSAGTHSSHEGRTEADNLVLTLRKWGIRDYRHVSHRVTLGELHSYNLILCMENLHVVSICEACREARIPPEKVFLMSEMIGGRFEIPDPFPGLSKNDPEPTDMRPYVAVGKMIDYVIRAGMKNILDLAG